MGNRNDRDLFAPPAKRTPRPRSEGERRRNEGCDRVLNNAGSAFQIEGLSVISALAREPHEFTVEEVHRRVTTMPKHPNAWGALMRVAHGQKLIRIVGHKRAGRDSAHVRRIPIYRGMPE